MKIYNPLLEKIKKDPIIDRNDSFDSQTHYLVSFEVIISFKNIHNRDKFLSKYSDLQINKIFNQIPSIATTLSINEILKFKNEELVNQVEEDQEVFLTYLDTIEILRLPEYKRNQIVFTGDGIDIGIVDIGIQGNFNSDSKRFQEKLYSVKKLKDFHKVNHDINITHGTLLANIIKTKFIDEQGFSIGLSPDSNIIDLKVSTNRENYRFSDLLHVLDQVDNKKNQLDILLIAFSTSEPSDGKDILSKMCNLLVEKKNIVVVAPAGNTGPEKCSIGSPGAAEKVITFGALDKNHSVARFSSIGPTLDDRNKPDFFLPGSNLIIPITEKIQIRSSGTSLSAALGVGIIALLKEYDKGLTVDEIRKILNKHGTSLNKNLQTLDMIEIFKGLGLVHEPIFSLKYLFRRSIWISIQIMIILVLIFNWKLIYNLIKLLYGF